MQMRNRAVENLVGNECLLEVMDFPTEEELLAALDASLEQAPWLPRALPLLEETTAQTLGQHACERTTAAPGANSSRWDGPDDKEWMAASKIEIEPEFLVEFLQFITHRIAQRVNELRQAQSLLQNELAPYQPNVLANVLADILELSL